MAFKAPYLLPPGLASCTYLQSSLCCPSPLHPSWLSGALLLYLLGLGLTLPSPQNYLLDLVNVTHPQNSTLGSNFFLSYLPSNSVLCPQSGLVPSLGLALGEKVSLLSP